MIAKVREVVRAHGHTWFHESTAFFSSINRMLFAAVAATGFAALACSVGRPWFAVPIALPQGAFAADGIGILSPSCTRWFQAGMALGAIGIAASWVWRRRWTMLSTALTSILCVVVLSYPYFVMVRSPVVSAEATWLQMQHDNLLWLGGDVYNNAELAQRGWKAKVYMIDTPRQLNVIPLPSWSPWEIGLDRSHDLLLWLGYSNAFCQFVGNGWFLAVTGVFLLLLSTVQQTSQFVFKRAGFALALFTMAALVSVIIGWSVPFQASRLIRQAHILFSDGAYQQSYSALQHAVAVLPVLAQDTHYVVQRGVLEKRLEIDSEYTRLRRATDLESRHCYEQSFQQLEPLVASADPAIRREAIRGVMRFAIQDYNSARFELAQQRFKIVHRHQPCNVKLLYLMQILALRQSRPQEVESLRDRMYIACDHLRFGTKKVLRAASQQNAVIAAGMKGDPSAIWSAQEKAKRP